MSRMIFLVLCLVIGLIAVTAMVPEEPPRPLRTVSRSRRSSGQKGQKVDKEAMYDELSHPFYDPLAKRPGLPTKTHSCNRIRRVPAELRKANHMRPKGLTQFYQKYTEAYGIPVVSSKNVHDDALKRACYTIRFLLADDSKVRKAFYKLSGRVAIIGKNENTTSIPEHSELPDWWNERARGMGANWYQPIATAGEENALCLEEDRYEGDDIVLHEYLHALHNLGANYAHENFEERIKERYNGVKASGIWDQTYAMSTDREYFSELGQSYLNAHVEAIPIDGIHNQINTRKELRKFDRYMYKLFKNEIFLCNNKYIPRCKNRKTSAQMRKLENKQVLKMDCNRKKKTTKQK